MSNPTGGPNTQAGKEVARWNATRHGIRSPAPVIPGLEKAEDWEEHRDGVLESLSPEGHLELVLAERVALLSWRLHRVNEEAQLEELDIPGIPETLDPESLFEYDVPWTVSLVREGTSVLAQAAGE